MALHVLTVNIDSICEIFKTQGESAVLLFYKIEEISYFLIHICFYVPVILESKQNKHNMTRHKHTQIVLTEKGWWLAITLEIDNCD